MMYDTCKVCGKTFETTTEEACKPWDCMSKKDHLCRECYLENKAFYDQ